MRIRHRITSVIGLAVSSCLLLTGLTGPTGLTGAAQAAAGPQVPVRGQTSQLNGVTCDPAGQCWAVGTYEVSGEMQNEILSWNGSKWVWVRLPRIHGQSGLDGISCPAASSCLAVGSTASVRGKNAQSEVMRWDGSSWSMVSAPAGVAGLSAVSCTTISDCWAVEGNVLVHWNGETWGTPVALSVFNSLASVACVSATDCWAAGFFVKPNKLPLFNLVEHWNGHAWAKVTAPQPSGGANQLHAITCVSAADCWAGGSRDAAAGNSSNELLHWNGGQWSQVTAPKGPHVNSELFGVQCQATSDCWAVGDDEGTTEALHWDGHAWSHTATPSPGGAGFFLGVQCLTASDCLAVGFSHLPPVINLAAQWNGTAWHTV